MDAHFEFLFGSFMMKFLVNYKDFYKRDKGICGVQGASSFLKISLWFHGRSGRTASECAVRQDDGAPFVA
jgi:hypothetical protein